MNNPMMSPMYSPMPANPYLQLPSNPVQSNNGINWVQGIEGAKAYQLSPNSNCILLDSENDGIFYIKVSDNVGMCNLRTFQFEEITNTPSSSVDLTGYVKKDELETLVKSIMGEKKNEQSISGTKSNKTITT